MSYDVYLTDPDTGLTLDFDPSDTPYGGTWCVGARAAWLSETFNYTENFVKALGEGGICGLSSRRAGDLIPLLQAGINRLKDDAVANYWESTEGNARAALIRIRKLCELNHDGILVVEA